MSANRMGWFGWSRWGILIAFGPSGIPLPARGMVMMVSIADCHVLITSFKELKLFLFLLPGQVSVYYKHSSFIS